MPFLRWLLSLDFVGSVFRLTLWLVGVIRQHTVLSAVGPSLGYSQTPKLLKSLTPEDRSKEILFILGSGESVNQMSASQFSLIDRHTSIGINVWVAHPFVPTAYSFEGGGFPVSSDETHHRQFLAAELAKKSQSPKFRGVIQLVPRAPHQQSQIVQIDQTIMKASDLLARVNLLKSRSVRGLRADVRLVLRVLRWRLVPLRVLPDSGATVVRLIFLGFRLGFQRVVLVGVDLNDSAYFWHREKATPQFDILRRLFPRAAGIPHDTLSTGNRPYSARDVIFQLGFALEKDYGVELFVASPTSSLAEKLPVFDWGEARDGRMA